MAANSFLCQMTQLGINVSTLSYPKYKINMQAIKCKRKMTKQQNNKTKQKN